MLDNYDTHTEVDTTRFMMVLSAEHRASVRVLAYIGGKSFAIQELQMIIFNWTRGQEHHNSLWPDQYS